MKLLWLFANSFGSSFLRWKFPKTFSWLLRLKAQVVFLVKIPHEWIPHKWLVDVFSGRNFFHTQRAVFFFEKKLPHAKWVRKKFRNENTSTSHVCGICSLNCMKRCMKNESCSGILFMSCQPPHRIYNSCLSHRVRSALLGF